MSRTLSALRSLSRRTALLSALVPAIATAQAVHAADEARITDQMRADCRAEGEGGGLEGAELEAYIRDCLNDLLTVEIRNIEE